ncbi:MAG: ComEA family DNA-binding protein [Syntrophothermus sp.]
MHYLKTIFILFILFFNYCKAQDSTNSIIDYISPEVFTSDDDVNIFLENLIDNPIDINKAEVKDLLHLPFMSFENTKLILAFRDSLGGFNQLSELYAIPDIQKNIIYRILPYIKISDEQSLNHSGKMDYTGKIYKRNNLNKFNLNDNRVLNKFTLTNSNEDIKAGLTFEKDPGEKNFNDYSSFYLEVNNFLSFDNIILGDYDIEFGEGLVNWSYSNYFRTSDGFSYYNKSNLKPHKYMNENLFYRGLSALTTTKYFDFIFFFSNNKIDAELDSNNNIKKFSSSTNNNNVSETAFGSIIKYQPNENFFLSFLFNSSIFDKPDIFNRKIFPSFSFYYNLSLNDINLSGEVANDKIRTAFVNTLKYFLNSALLYKVQLNYIPHLFTSFHRRYFNRYDLDGLNLSNNLIYFTTFGEIIVGTDFMSRIKSEEEIPDGSNFNINYISKIFYKLSYRMKYYINIDNYTTTGERYRKQVFSNELNYFLDYSTKLKSRLEYYTSAKDNKNINGYILFNQIDYRINNNLNLCFNFSFFNQNDERLYGNVIDNDLTGNYQAVSYEGTGSRWYISTSYNFFDNYRLLFYYSQIRKKNNDNYLNMILNVEI